MPKAKVFALVGCPDAIKKLKRYKEAVHQAVEKSVIESAYILLRESLKLCPIDTGDLRRSGEVRPSGSGIETTAIVAYTQSYAIYVHENLESFHKPPTQAKFLEEPARRFRRDIATKIQRDVRAGIRNASGLGWMDQPFQHANPSKRGTSSGGPRTTISKKRTSIRKVTTSRHLRSAENNRGAYNLKGTEKRKALADKLREIRRYAGPSFQRAYHRSDGANRTTNAERAWKNHDTAWTND